MKVTPKKIDATFEYDESYKSNPGINDISQKLNLTPFVYNSQISKTFKLVLTWDFKLTNNETGKQIIKCDADQEFIMQLDNNNDKEVLRQ